MLSRETQTTENSIALEKISEGYLCLDHQFTVREANSITMRALNKSREDVIGKRVWELFTKEEIKTFQPYFSQLREEEKPMLFETSCRGNSFSVHAYPEEDKGLSVFFINMTEIGEAEEKLKASLSSKNDFISIASHELKTPLTAITLQVEMAKALDKNEHLSAEKIKLIMNRTHQDVLRMARLVDDMLDVSRINNDKFQMSFEFFPFEEFIEDLVSRMVPYIIEENKLSVQLKAPVMVKWDKFRMEQVLINLLTNAFRYGENSRIELSAAEEGGFVVIKVKDQGRGISPELRSKIFEKFERGSSNDKDGMGLGLYICHEIVKLHHGKIQLESEEGEGCCFTLKIPITIKS